MHQRVMRRQPEPLDRSTRRCRASGHPPQTPAQDPCTLPQAALVPGYMATDRSALPLQGFVSNKDSEREDGKGDPLETLLYAVLVASSARASVAELATILQVGLLGASETTATEP